MSNRSLSSVNHSLHGKFKQINQKIIGRQTNDKKGASMTEPQNANRRLVGWLSAIAPNFFFTKFGHSSSRKLYEISVSQICYVSVSTRSSHCLQSCTICQILTNMDFGDMSPRVDAVHKKNLLNKIFLRKIMSSTKAEYASISKYYKSLQIFAGITVKRPHTFLQSLDLVRLESILTVFD